MTSFDETQEGQEKKLLNAWQLIKDEVLSVPAMSNAEEQTLATQALNGDEQARETLATYCVRFAIQKAGKYTQFGYSYDEYHDLIGAANEKLATVLDTALTKENSVAYIRKAMKYGVIDASRYYRQFVRVSLDEVAEKLGMELRLPSPEAPQENVMLPLLREALSTLTEKQRYVVERVYGLDGEAPETLQQINARIAVNGGHTVANQRLVRAFRRLRNALE